ncbi:MAG: hypothetical protein J1F60_03045 [Oscillospiraceae bacterium]|nr:hypothetical protein [Oscillospiraceae bacterium]
MDENEVIDEMNETEEAKPEVLTCPVCGEELEPGTENCPLCGAPVGTLESNDISGTSIDNSAAIDAMLQSAAMLVEESASLGVSLDDDDEEDDTDEEGFAPVQEEEDDPMEPVAAFAMPSDLTAEQQSQIEAGGMINLSSAPPPPAPEAAPEPAPAPAPKKASKKKPKQEPITGPTLYEVDESGNPVPEQEDKEEAPYVPPAQKPAKPKKKKRASSPVLVVAAAVVALALGCAVGFFGKMLLFPDMTLPACQEFAERAVTGVNSVVDGDIYITEAYVAKGGDATQCIFRAAVCTDGDTALLRWFRVKVYDDAPDTVRIYFQLDMDRYNAMINSDDDEQHIQASMLMNNQQELDRCINEIKSGTGGWSAANAGMLNEALRPTPEASGKDSSEAE